MIIEKLRNILIIDDDVGIRETLRDILMEYHDNVSIAPDGYAAIEMVLKCQFDLILLDMRMPGINGLETLQEIRNKPVNSKIFIITAYARDELLQKAIKIGIDGIFYKPFNMNELVHILDIEPSSNKREIV